MAFKADFYVGNEADLDWIGSVMIHGDPWHVPVDLMIQINQTMFEEIALEYIQFKNGYMPDRGEQWPHPWADSRMTDYSFIFDTNIEKVVMYQSGVAYLVDPVKIVQGYSIEESIVHYGEPKFPLMREETLQKTEELLHGQVATSPV